MTQTPQPAARRLEWIIFALVGAAFTNIYITQPVLPVLEVDFDANTVAVARSVGAVLLGIALANLPFGYLSDRVALRPLMLLGGTIVSLAGVFCATSTELDWLIGARFVQGLFLPAITTCLAAYLAKTLPTQALNPAMGSYVAATILGGLFGRLLGGFICDPAHWRDAFYIAAALTFSASAIAVCYLPEDRATVSEAHQQAKYIDLLRRRDLLPIYLCAAVGQAIFSPVFNTVSYRLAEAPMGLSTRESSLVYLVYVFGVAMGPLAGRMSNRFGNGASLMAGAAVLGASVIILAQPSVIATVIALFGICGGFFGVHAAAVGALNHKLAFGQGRANALYVMCYYLGAWFGIAWSAWVYQHHGWSGVVLICLGLTTIPLVVGLTEHRHYRSTMS